MKCKFIILSTFLVVSSLYSCKKDSYQCSCSIFDDTTIHTITDLSEKEAEETCTNLNSWYAEDQGSCSLITAEENE